jgi:hypothetical protein
VIFRACENQLVETEPVEECLIELQKRKGQK